MIKTTAATIRSCLFAIVGLSTACVALEGATAQEYPDRLIKIVSVTGPGNPIDEYSRRLARYLGEKLKQTVIIENRPGGNSILAPEAVANARPDGYTFLFAASASMSANPYLFKKLSYNPTKDFVPVARLSSSTLALVVPGSSPLTSLEQLVSAARKAPGKLNSASSGPTYRILVSAAYRAAGIDVTDVPYKTASSVMTDLLAGVVDCALMEFAFSRPNLEAGKLRGLALLTPRRSPLLPNIPTFGELGLADTETIKSISQVTWNGLFAPAGTPAEIVATIERLALEFVNSPDAVAYAVEHGLMPDPGSSAELGRIVLENQKAWKEMIPAAGIEPQ